MVYSVHASRYFLVFDPELSNDVISETGNRALFQPREAVADVRGLIAKIRDEFGIPRAKKLHLAVNGYPVPHWCLISVLRDNDELAVLPAGHLLAALPAAPKEAHAQPLQLTAPEGGPGVQPPADAGAQSKPKKKRSKAEGADAADGEGTIAEAAPKKWKAVTAQAPNGQPGSGAGAPPETPQQPPQSTPDSTSEGSEGEAGRTPSRSARRKKLKRQLRREAGTSGCGAGARAAGHTPPSRLGAHRPPPAADDAGAHGGRPPHLPLPKRGEAWSMGAREQRFASNGHVYFSESDEEGGARRVRQKAQQPAQRAERAQRAEQAHGRAPVEISAAGGAAMLIGPGAPEHAAAPRHLEVGEASQQAAAVMKAVPQHPSEQQGPCTDAQFEALPRPQPLPFEGDIIGYRLLHIGADWTPQVSEWRKGRVIDWEEGTQTLTVEPWPDPAVHPLQPPHEVHRRELTGNESWAELDSLALPEHREGERGEEGEEDEEEADGEDGLPSDYSTDGVLTATLQTFADLCVISEPHAPAAVRHNGDGMHGGSEQAAAPGPAAAEAAAAVAPAPLHYTTTPVKQSKATEQAQGLSNGGVSMPVHGSRPSGDAATPAQCSPAVPAQSSAHVGPPKPGRPDAALSITAWKDLAEQLKRRRAELAAQQGTPPGSMVASQHHAAQPNPTCSGAGNGALEERCGDGAGTPEELPAGGDGGENSGTAGTAQKLQGSAVATPGAARPPPGVRATSVGAFLQRMRQQGAQAAFT